jgi:glycosyltransferase involved in cell wall biosynthesis
LWQAIKNALLRTHDKTVTAPLPQITSKKRWLLLSHGFNMDGRAASQTITDKIPYFLGAGVELTVFSSITGIRDTRFVHRQFLAWGPAAFRFDFRHWFANQYGRGLPYKVLTTAVSILLAPFIALEKMLLGFSSQWSWAMPAYLHGRALIQNKEVDLVYSTAGAWSAQLAALWLKKSTGVFWMAEIHDPLVIRSSPDDLGFGVPPNRDARFRKWLEAQICKHADVAWWFTDGAVHYAKVRNPNLNEPGNAKGVMVIPGAEPPGAAAEISSLARQVEQPTDKTKEAVQSHRYGSHLVISHFGSLAKNRSIATILNRLPNLFQRHPEARSVIQIHVYGAKVDSVTADAITQYGFADLVIEHGRIEKDPVTGKSGRERIAERMQASDVLLLLHGDDAWCAEYIPSKMYEYFWMGRPIWAITHLNPQMNALLTERNAYISAAADVASIDQTLDCIWQDWQQKNLRSLARMPIGVDQAAQRILQFL